MCCFEADKYELTVSNSLSIDLPIFRYVFKDHGTCQFDKRTNYSKYQLTRWYAPKKNSLENQI